MYAIIEVGSKQFKVAEGDQITVDRIATEVGNKVKDARVLFMRDKSSIKIGKPVIADAQVDLTVEKHFRGQKTTVLRFKRRGGHRSKIASRADLSLLNVKKISSK